MIPYWKRVPITAPPVLLELDPTNDPWCWLNDQYSKFQFPVREDPFDVYEDALGG